MIIQSIRFSGPDDTVIVVTHDDKETSLSWPCQTWHAKPIQAWLNAGNQIAPYQRFETVDQARTVLIGEVYAHAAALIDQATSGYAAGEIAAWTDLEREAEQYQADGTLGPLMQAEIDQGQRSAPELAEIVLRKAAALRAWRARVIGARTRHVDAVNAAELETLQGYDTGTGWPVWGE